MESERFAACEFINISTKSLSVAVQGQAVVSSLLLVGVLGALAQSTGMTTSSRESAQLAVLVHSIAEPVDAGVVADGVVGGVNKDDFKVFVGGVLVHPVGAEHTQVGASAANTLLGHTSEVALEFQVLDTLVGGLSVHDTLGVGALASTTAHANSVDDES